VNDLRARKGKGKVKSPLESEDIWTISIPKTIKSVVKNLPVMVTDVVHKREGLCMSRIQQCHRMQLCNWLLYGFKMFLQSSRPSLYHFMPKGRGKNKFCTLSTDLCCSEEEEEDIAEEEEGQEEFT
jgi:hypothetical protein